MAIKCIILDDYQSVALSCTNWNVLQPTVDVRAFSQHFSNIDEQVTALQAAEIVIIMRERTPFGADLFARLPGLKLLITSGMRNAAIDLPAARRHGVVVCGTASGSEPPAELSWALILGLARHLVVENTALRENGPWQQTLGITLHGKTLGLIGLGKIGGQMARIAQAFGMDVCAWSQNLSAERAAECNVRLMPDKATLLQHSDIVSLHLVLSERSRHIIDAEALRQMKSTALLINTSRAGLVDQQAMISALRERRIAGAGVDVFDEEPLPANSPLRTLAGLLATPHLGYVADTNYQRYFSQAVENIQAWLAGEPIRILNKRHTGPITDLG